LNDKDYLFNTTDELDLP